MGKMDLTIDGFSSFVPPEERFLHQAQSHLQGSISLRNKNLKSTKNLQWILTAKAVASTVLLVLSLVSAIALLFFKPPIGIALTVAICTVAIPLWISKIQEWRSEIASCSLCLQTEKLPLLKLKSCRSALTEDLSFREYAYQSAKRYEEDFTSHLLISYPEYLVEKASQGQRL